MIHLDTSFLIRALVRGTPEDRGPSEVDCQRASRWRWCSVAWAEFQCGPLTSSELAVAGAIIDGHRDFTRDQRGDRRTTLQRIGSSTRVAHRLQ